MVSEFHSLIHIATELRTSTLLRLFDKIDAGGAPTVWPSSLTAAELIFVAVSALLTRVSGAGVRRRGLCCRIRSTHPADPGSGYQGEAIRQKLGRERQLATRAVRERWLDR